MRAPLWCGVILKQHSSIIGLPGRAPSLTKAHTNSARSLTVMSGSGEEEHE